MPNDYPYIAVIANQIVNAVGEESWVRARHAAPETALESPESPANPEPYDWSQEETHRRRWPFQK